MTIDEIKKIDEENIWHPFGPIKGGDLVYHITKAEGVWLHLANGRKILDAISSWWVNVHGHSNPELAEALYAQAKNLEHAIFAGFTHQPAAELTKNLLELLPDNQQRLFFSDNGSTAVEVGVKAGLQYWYNRGISKKKIVALEGGYHGDTFGAMSLAGKSDFFTAFDDFMYDVTSLPFPHPGKEEATINAFKEAVKDDDVGLFVFEPIIQGSAGMRAYSPEVLNTLLDIAKAHDVLTVADEVMTGFWRTGTFMAMEQTRHQADIICLSKILSGGMMPMGITSFSKTITDVYEQAPRQNAFYHGHSYTGNPLACAIGVKSLDMLRSDYYQNQISMIRAEHSKALETLKQHALVSTCTVTGTILTIEIDTAEKTSYFNSIRDVLYKAFLEKGILLRPLGNIIYVMPPFIIKAEELHAIYDAIQDVLNDLSSTQ